MPLSSLPRTIRFFFPKIEEWLLGAVPSSLSYEGLFKALHVDPRMIVVGTVALAVLFAFTLSVGRVHKRRRALSEILATGYHINFVEQLEGGMRANDKVLVNGAQLTITGVRITLPRNVNELMDHMGAVKQDLATGRLIEVPYQRRTVMLRTTPSGGALIHDFPRTLASFSEYLTQEGDTNADGDVPARYYKWFGNTMLALKKRRLDRYDRFQYVDVRDVPY